MTHELNKQLSRTGAVIAAACAALMAGQASAQTATTNSASLNGGWGRIQGTENQGINVRTRDENGNRIIVDGIIQDGSDNTEYVDSNASGAGSVYAGAGGRRRGGGSATAIGNNLQVITQGSWNTVIVNSTQINNGNVTANSRSVLNGELKLND
ncbi:MAG TPA: holdfast anchoring protein HfaA [Caulobacteraceae bacterium]|jgi:holdfast attachment protein HfaA